MNSVRPFRILALFRRVRFYARTYFILFSCLSQLSSYRSNVRVIFIYLWALRVSSFISLLFSSFIFICHLETLLSRLKFYSASSIFSKASLDRALSNERKETIVYLTRKIENDFDYFGATSEDRACTLVTFWRIFRGRIHRDNRE